MFTENVKNLYEFIVGIFTFTTGFSFLVIVCIFGLKLLFDMLRDWLFGDLVKYLNVFFLPGSFFHQLFHSLAIRILGYDVSVVYSMNLVKGDYSAQRLRGELKNVWHAFLIGYAPLLNFLLVVLLITNNNQILYFYYLIGINNGIWVNIYLLIALIFFGLPDYGDQTLPFATITAHHGEFSILLFFGVFFLIVGISVWGYLIPLINFALYLMFIIWLASQNYFAAETHSVFHNFNADREGQSRTDNDSPGVDI